MGLLRVLIGEFCHVDMLANLHLGPVGKMREVEGMVPEEYRLVLVAKRSREIRRIRGQVYTLDKLNCYT